MCTIGLGPPSAGFVTACMEPLGVIVCFNAHFLGLLLCFYKCNPLDLQVILLSLSPCSIDSGCMWLLLSFALWSNPEHRAKSRWQHTATHEDFVFLLSIAGSHSTLSLHMMWEGFNHSRLHLSNRHFPLLWSGVCLLLRWNCVRIVPFKMPNGTSLWPRPTRNKWALGIQMPVDAL